ncbi:nuclease-related domain-containing protein [Gracilibacillus sp. S3-1-1]|uniref:Nuclease-related domain-containing protein n=1 Tax=Gracilibacillus pellucidus TaxID=3095368 RepID=A0ACC6M7E5_9BACI|nr:nuclease-related domain-containing protein [Gracilibacillus sp. S3-1-1]MDX8046732.1 nuclease-related domain-containing protein [Gracilibacillus sp. S3-1-1]
MIVKPPEKTEQLRQLEIIMKRRSSIPSDLSELYGRELAGYLGEQSLPYYLHLASFTSHYDLYNLRLEFNNYHFQMDGLFLFPTFFLLIEVKHLKGTISINQAGQLIQTKESEEKIYQHPLHQANLQKEQLQHLLYSLGHDTIPIHTLTTLTHREANLTFHDPDVIPIQQLPFRIKELSKTYAEAQLIADKRLQLSKQLISLHRNRPLSFSKLTKDNVKNIKRGVYCPRCEAIMKRIYGTWKCYSCGCQDKQAHLSALIDYSYLFGYSITNKQARWFLLLDSIYTTSRLLKQLDIESKGRTKFRIYNLKNLLLRK